MAVAIRVWIVQWVEDDPQPGIVECRFTDRFGIDRTFIEKYSVVSTTLLSNDSPYPRPGVVGCTFISTELDDNGQEFAVVDTAQPWGIASIDGNTRFEVFVDQLCRV